MLMLFLAGQVPGQSSCDDVPLITIFELEGTTNPVENCTGVNLHVQIYNSNDGPECLNETVEVRVDLYFAHFGQQNFDIKSIPSEFSFVGTDDYIPTEPGFDFDRYSATYDLVSPDLEDYLEFDVQFTSNVTNGAQQIFGQVTGTSTSEASPFESISSLDPIRISYEVGDPTDPPSTELQLSTMIGGNQAGQMHTAAQSEVLQQNILVHNTLVFDTDYFISNSSKFVLGPDASFIIKSGVTLTIEDGSSLLGCEDMWKTVEVLGGGELIIDNSTVEDGKVAITANPGAHLQIVDTEFRNNNLGLKIISQTPTGVDIFLSNFHGNTFESTRALKAPFAPGIPYAGVEVNGTVIPLDLSGSPGTGVNRYQHMHNGIVAVDASLYVANSRFENLRSINIPGATTPSISGHAIHARSKGVDRILIQEGFGDGETSDVSILDCDYGIFARRMNLDISANHMREVTTGIYAERGLNRSAEIYENRITASQTCISLYQNTKVNLMEVKDNHLTVSDPDIPNISFSMGVRAEEFSTAASAGLFDYRIEDNTVVLENGLRGIRFTNAALAMIKNNTVVAPTTGQIVQDAKGIELEGARYTTVICNALTGNDQDNESKGLHGIQSYGSKIRCNTADNFQRGMNFFGECDATALLGNQFKDADYGLQVGTFSNNGGDSWIGTQPFRGNLWSGTHTGAPAWYQLPNPVFASNVPFLIDPNNPAYTQQHPSGIQPQNWFQDQNPNGQSTFNCATNNTCPDGIGDPDFIGEIEKKIAERDLPIGYCAGAHLWTASRHLYDRLLRDTSLLNVAGMQDFLDSAALTSIGAFHEVDLQLDELFALESSTAAQLDSNRASMVSNTAALQAVLGQLVGNPQDSALLAQQQQLEATLGSLAQANDTLVSEVDSLRQLAIGGVKLANYNVSTSAQFEVDQKRVNEIFLETIADGVDTFTTAQKTDLLAIADQCIICGATAVPLARSLYSLVEPDRVFNDEVLCATSNQPFRKPPTVALANLDFSLRPNPAKDWLLLEFDGPVTMEGTIVIFDALGKKVGETRLVLKDADTMPVDVGHLQAGIYSLTVLSDQATVNSRQFIITK